MNNSNSEFYKQAGVDITAGYSAVKLMKPYVESTFTKGVIGSIGGFGGLFAPDLSGMKKPVFVSGTDGVGTKLKIAFLMDKHDTVGIDCVAMCVNDIICAGAIPLFFLDYIASGKSDPQKIATIVKGIAEGCIQAGCALIGGESAEMPGFYTENEYDLVGFSTGMVDQDAIIEQSSVKAGDVLIGLRSSGVHSNGFSLVRKVLGIDEDKVRLYVNELGKTLGEELLTPTKIFVKPVLSLFQSVPVHGLCNITGGGYYENVPRMLPVGIRAVFDKKSIPTPPIFDIIQKAGDISNHDMFNTFNMGIGMVAAIDPKDADKAIAALRSEGQEALIVGECKKGEHGAEIIQ